MKRQLLQLIFIAAAMCVAVQSQGAIAFNPVGSQIVPGEPSGNDALFFTPTADITVSALGYFNNPTVSYPHTVGLYEVTSVVGNPTDYSGTVSGVSGSTTLTSISGNLLASSSVTGTGGSAAGDFYYNAIAPVTLKAGQLYAVDGYYAGAPDAGVYATGGVGANPLINYSYYLWDYASTGPELPLNTYAPAILGPNFEFSVAPEPGTYGVLAGVGLLAVSLRNKFSRKQA